jgi:hypothetical protein
MFVNCVLNRHGLCPGTANEQVCSCSCHTDPNFKHVCSACGEPVEWKRNRHGVMQPMDVGTLDFHMKSCLHWKHVFVEQPHSGRTKTLAERINETPTYHER